MRRKFIGEVEFPVTVEIGKGLEGAIACQTQIGYVDGQQGRLIYRGYTIEDLASNSTFEETAYLLLFGKLPTKAELSEFEQKLASSRPVPREVMDILRKLPQDCHPMTALQTGVAALGAFDKQAAVIAECIANPADALQTESEIAVRLTSQLATISAAIGRLRKGQEPIEPRTDLSHAANFLYMLHGQEPTELMARVFDVVLILHADHGMNASTFTAMVVHSTLSDMYASIAAAVGALKGPLHGGANEAALKDLLKVNSPETAESYVSEKLARKEKIMGFGHRVYKAYDPRARILRGFAQRLCEQLGKQCLFATAEAVEKAVVDRLGSKGIFPNVDFYSGIVYHCLGIEPELFPVVFAVSRVAGWAARILEYLPDNRIFRPRAVYTGPIGLQYVPIDRRGD